MLKDDRNSGHILFVISDTKTAILAAFVKLSALTLRPPDLEPF